MFAFLSLFALCNGGSWRQTGNSIFPIMDIGINDVNATFSTELASSGSWLVKSSNLGTSWDVLEESNDGLMDISCSSLDKETAVVSSVMGRVLFTLDGGANWQTAIEPLFGTQSIQRSRDGSKYYCGAGGNKISISTDKGFTWKHHSITGLNNGSRYCALPSSKVWYVTAGFWIEEDEDENNMHLTSLITLNKQTGVFSFKQSIARQHTQRRMQGTGMWAELYKTTDAGVTWTRQLADDNRFYFNGIDCCDETHCVAVGEGDSDAGSDEPGSRVFITADGNNWKQVHYDPVDGSSLMTAHCLSDTEYYVGGGDIVGGIGNFFGFLLHTTDGGQTWSNTTVKAPVMWMDMSDDGRYGVASGISRESGGVEYGYS